MASFFNEGWLFSSWGRASLLSWGQPKGEGIGFDGARGSKKKKRMGGDTILLCDLQYLFTLQLRHWEDSTLVFL